MPFGDRTGPAGLGPMSGRGAGFCGGYGVPGTMNPAPGRGFGGRGRGGGRGWRNCFHATGLTGWQRTSGWPVAGAPRVSAPTREQEIAALKAQAEQFESALGDIRKRLEDLETKPRQE
jgi:hypothetical protein